MLFVVRFHDPREKDTGTDLVPTTILVLIYQGLSHSLLDLRLPRRTYYYIFLFLGDGGDGFPKINGCIVRKS